MESLNCLPIRLQMFQQQLANLSHLVKGLIVFRVLANPIRDGIANIEPVKH